MDLVAALAAVVAAPPQPVGRHFDLTVALDEMNSADDETVAAPVLAINAPRGTGNAPAARVTADDVSSDERPLRGPALAAALEEQRAAEPERMPWPASWFDRNDPADAHRCRQMWAEVLRVCLIGVCEEVVDGGKKKAWQRRKSAGQPHWIGSQGFFDVCNLVGLDGVAVKERLSPKLATVEGALEVWRALSVAGGVFARNREARQ